MIAKIRDVRIGLEDLANKFQANPRLQVQYLKLAYATEAALNAERLAAAGRYNDAGKFWSLRSRDWRTPLSQCSCFKSERDGL